MPKVMADMDVAISVLENKRCTTAAQNGSCERSSLVFQGGD
jgi:hypothetical protein